MKLRPVRFALTKQFLEDFQPHAAITSAVLVAGSLATVALAPTIRDRGRIISAADELPEGIAALLGIKPGLSLNTAAGHVDGWMVSLAAPLVLCALALPLAVRAIAGSEARGEMEWLAAQPVRRTQIVVERFIALAILVVEAAIPATIALAIGSAIGELELDALTVVWAMGRVVILVVLLAGIALVASAMTKSVKVAIGAAVLVPIVAFGLIVYTPAARLSPVRWTLGETPVAESAAITGIGLAVVLTGWLVIIAAAGFSRRDLAL